MRLLYVCAALLLAAASPAVAQCDAPFGPSSLVMPDAPRRPALADVNNDGNIDIVAIAGSGVAVRLSTGAGTYAPAQEYPTSPGARQIDLGDLNGDGFIDAVVISAESSTFDALLNNGDGTFAASAAYPIAGPGVWITLGDVDDDGDRDVVLSNGSANSMSIFLNDGSGGFTLRNTFGIIGYPYCIRLADLDGDGLLDIAAAMAVDVEPAGGGEVVFIMPNLGFTDDTWMGFTPWILTPSTYVEVGSAPFEVAVAELDGNPGLDLAVINAAEHTISVAFNLGDGTFTTETVYPSDVSTDLGFDDIDGDGDLDMLGTAFGSSDAAFIIRYNDGAGGFDVESTVDVGLLVRGVAHGDLDGDGDVDLVAADGNGAVAALYINDGAGVFTNAPLNYDAGDSPWQIALRDMDGDGTLDAIVRNASSAVSIMRGDGAGGFDAPEVYPAAVHPRSLKLVDVNGDGFDDVFSHKYIESGNAPLSMQLNNGDGTLAPEVQTLLSGSVINGIDFADLDDDDDPDLIYTYTINTPNPGGGTHSTYHTGYRFNDGTGTFINEQSQTNPPPGWANPNVAELNGDGHPDIVYDSLLLKIGVQLSTGPGTWSPITIYPVGRFSQDLEMVDLDGDGDLDIAVSNRLDLNVGVLLNDGSGAFAAMVTYPTPGPPFSLATADLDGDGDIDIVTPLHSSQDPQISKVSVMFNNGDGTFGESVIHHAGATCLYAALDDLNGDGAIDMVITNSGRDDMSVYLNACAAPPPPCPADCSPDNGDGSFGNGVVNIDDLLAVIAAFGAGPAEVGPCDVAPDNGDGTFGNGVVNIDDLLTVISAFGPCEVP